MKLIAPVIVAMVMFISCVQQNNYTIKTPFRAEDWRIGIEAGNTRIEGQAFLKTKDGAVKTCAGEEVILMPYNAYTEELYTVAKQGRFGNASNFDSNIIKYCKVTTCDDNGDFKFENIPSGKWLIYTRVAWEVPGENSSSPQGGDMAKIVQTTEKDTQKVYLTEADRTY
jgi:hypothetical protein